MNIKKRFIFLVAIVFSLFLIGSSTNVNANDFDDVKEIPFTTPVNP